jgi:hypothetical protein
LLTVGDMHTEANFLAQIQQMIDNTPEAGGDSSPTA